MLDISLAVMWRERNVNKEEFAFDKKKSTLLMASIVSALTQQNASNPTNKVL